MKIKKQRHKKCVIKRILKFQVYKNCLEAAQIENKMSHLEKKKIDVIILKESIKNNKLILKAQQRFKRERHHVFIEEINQIALSVNDGTRI